MLVTPLRDGMNLVAKEYVASRVDELGALVLSEFAGAAAELEEAVLVNPYDLGAVAKAVKLALAMSEAEQGTRMRALRARVRSGDVQTWVGQFLKDLGGEEDDVMIDDAPPPLGPIGPHALDGEAADHRRHRRRVMPAN